MQRRNGVQQESVAFVSQYIAVLDWHCYFKNAFLKNIWMRRKISYMNMKQETLLKVIQNRIKKARLIHIFLHLQWTQLGILAFDLIFKHKKNSLGTSTPSLDFWPKFNLKIWSDHKQWTSFIHKLQGTLQGCRKLHCVPIQNQWQPVANC